VVSSATFQVVSAIKNTKANETFHIARNAGVLKIGAHLYTVAVKNLPQ
jgi:hypothetical protein